RDGTAQEKCTVWSVPADVLGLIGIGTTACGDRVRHAPQSLDGPGKLVDRPGRWLGRASAEAIGCGDIVHPGGKARPGFAVTESDDSLLRIVLTDDVDLVERPCGKEARHLLPLEPIDTHLQRAAAAVGCRGIVEVCKRFI